MKNNKPEYCKNPVATDQGWIDSDTGELLVAIKGLKGKLLGVDDSSDAIPVKRGRGRPRKNK